MDPVTTISLVCGLLILLWIARSLHTLLEARSTAAAHEPGAPELPAKPVKLHVVQATPRCDGCKHFDIDAGQELKRAHPAFHAATGTLAPWQMGVAHRRFEPNPDYAALQKKLAELVEEGEEKNLDRIRVVQAEIERLNPQQLASPDEYVDPGLMKLRWNELGLCGLHNELRFGPDSCEAFVAVGAKEAKES